MTQLTFKSLSTGQLPLVQICKTPEAPSDIISKKNLLNSDQTHLLNQPAFTSDLPFTAKNDTLFSQEADSSPLSAMKPPARQTENIFASQNIRYVSSPRKKLSLGLTFAEEAKVFQEKKKIKLQTKSDSARLVPIYIRQATRTVPVVSKHISGARFIFDSPSLLNYCMKWCQTVYADSVVLRPIPHTGTVLLIFPRKSAHYVQFVYHNGVCNEPQRLFQQQIAPIDVKVFHAFTPFADWIKKQTQCEA